MGVRVGIPRLLSGGNRVGWWKLHCRGCVGEGGVLAPGGIG